MTPNHKPTAVEALHVAREYLLGRYDLDHPAIKWIDAALVAQPEESTHVPDEWVTVPREPTREMLDAANREWGGRMDARSSGVWQAMLSAAPAAPGREEWRDIESAPKDGKDILVRAEGGEMFVAFWDGCAFVFATARDRTAIAVKTPTHWRPLPSAPAKEV